MKYFESSVVYDRQTENGIKTVKEQYVVKADNCTEVEKKVVEEITPFTWEEIPEISSIKWADFSEVVTSDEEKDDIYWKVKVAFITIDEKTMKEKLARMCYLVQAASAVKAKTSLDEHLSGTMLDYKVTGITETKILNVF